MEKVTEEESMLRKRGEKTADQNQTKSLSEPILSMNNSGAGNHDFNSMIEDVLQHSHAEAATVQNTEDVHPSSVDSIDIHQVTKKGLPEKMSDNRDRNKIEQNFVSEVQTAMAEKNACKRKFNEINSKMDELLARFNVIERILIKKTSNSKDDVVEVDEQDEVDAKRETFVRSNELPIKTINDLNRFEANLKNPVFLNTAVSTHSIINTEQHA